MALFSFSWKALALASCGNAKAPTMARLSAASASGRKAPPTTRKEVTLLDVQDRTASAKLTAFWGTDYLLLGKFGDQWMVSSVLWQSPPANH